MGHSELGIPNRGTKVLLNNRSKKVSPIMANFAPPISPLNPVPGQKVMHHREKK
jgi:hypothetical protein